MNSINTQSKPMIGTKDKWGLSYLVWIVVIVCAMLVKGCNNDSDHPLFIFKEATTWN